MKLGLPPTPLYILIAIIFTGVSIAATVHNYDHLSRPLGHKPIIGGLCALIVGWSHVAGWVAFDLSTATLRVDLFITLHLLPHLAALVAIFIAGLGFIEFLSIPKAKQASNMDHLDLKPNQPE